MGRKIRCFIIAVFGSACVEVIEYVKPLQREQAVGYIYAFGHVGDDAAHAACGYDLCFGSIHFPFKGVYKVFKLTDIAIEQAGLHTGDGIAADNGFRQLKVYFRQLGGALCKGVYRDADAGEYAAALMVVAVPKSITIRSPP